MKSKFQMHPWLVIGILIIVLSMMGCSPYYPPVVSQERSGPQDMTMTVREMCKDKQGVYTLKAYDMTMSEAECQPCQEFVEPCENSEESDDEACAALTACWKDTPGCKAVLKTELIRFCCVWSFICRPEDANAVTKSLCTE